MRWVILGSGVLVLSLAGILFFWGGEQTPDSPMTRVMPERVGKILTLGSISDNPKREFKRFLPFAQYLAGELGDLGYGTGKLIIAPTMESMGEMMKAGKVDLFIGLFPTLSA